MTHFKTNFNLSVQTSTFNMRKPQFFIIISVKEIVVF